MALNRLTIAEMVMLLEDWVTPGRPVRDALEQYPSLAGLIPSIDAAHTLLVDIQPVELAAARAELTGALTDKDARFDHLARAVDAILNAHLALALADGDLDTVGELRALTRIILPHGLNVVTMSYREESGQTALLAERLTSAHEAFMATLTVRNSNLLEVVRAWVQAGSQLGALAHRRTDLNLPTRRTSQSRARSQWIQTITTVRSVVALTGITDPRIEEALGRIAATEVAAERRAQAREDAGLGDTDGDALPDDLDGGASDGEVPDLGDGPIVAPEPELPEPDLPEPDLVEPDEITVELSATV